MGGEKGRDADDLIRTLDKDNRELYPKTQKYLDNATPQTSRALEGHGTTLHKDLDDVFNSVRPRAVFTKPDFNQPARDVSENEAEHAARAAKEAIGPVGNFAGQNDEANAKGASEASRRMAALAEAVYLKASDKKVPAVSQTKLREVARDLTDKNKALVTATNGYLDSPDDSAKSDKLRSAVRNANNSVDRGLQAFKDANTALKSFEDQIEAASNSIRNAASEWDADDDIVAAALRIAEEMRKLAAAARAMDRKAIILHARNISALVKSEIIQYADKRRAACSDATVRNELSTGEDNLYFDCVKCNFANSFWGRGVAWYGKSVCRAYSMRTDTARLWGSRLGES